MKVGVKLTGKVHPENEDGITGFLYACENGRYDIVRIISSF